ncbi:MAG: GIY-YIG nuclease family protein [Clostridiales bacterium]|nr:GIY-YIG nuclease family protein [Clostridiales bacterium]
MYYVYILTNATNVSLYTGVTNNLERRLWEHRNHADPRNFTSRYNIYKLVYFEQTTDVQAAIAREKQIKAMSRAKKNKMIEKQNPEWDELLLSGIL